MCTARRPGGPAAQGAAAGGGHPVSPPPPARELSSTSTRARPMSGPGREGRRGDQASGRRTGLTEREEGLGGAGVPAAKETVMARIDRFCDTVPRQRARAEKHGPLVLFVTEGPGWPYYARPKQGARGRITATDVRRVRPVSVSSASPSPS